MKPAQRLRCAIYTRVSTEHGLEQEFNSLDAQREAAEAYVKSQAHEGWIGLKDRFDDGGYSGGSMERPALQTLLNAVKARRVDVVVVYKVDRLTRSLADFAKLVELFDAHEVSFVSVTQSFNTTSSMGRLTLNVLLSFAQFEREVTGERIRDKIAASKKKGLWMGGIVPYGYRYYQSWVMGHGQKEKAGTITRVPAGDVERAIIEALEKRFLEQNEAIPNIEIQSQRVRATIRKVTIHPQHIAVELNAPVPVNAAAAYDASGISRPASEAQTEGSVSHQDQPEIITIAWAKPAATRNRQVLVVPNAQQSLLPLKSETRARILTSIVQARLWLDQLTNGKVPDVAALARRHDRSEKSVRSLLSLAFLAPNIVEAAASNRLPRGLGITNLTGLPADWSEQRRQLGLG